MEKTITFKPIFWRLMIWRILPLLIGWLAGAYAYQMVNPISSFDPLASSVGISIGGLMITALLRNQFDIVISENQISGTSPGLTQKKVIFSLADLDRSRLYKQSFYEKISGSHTLHSVHGQKIMFPHFIYGTSVVNEVYKILEGKQAEKVME